MTPSIANVEAVRAKLASAGDDVAAAEARLRSVSLAAALSEDPNGAAAEATAKLTAARQRVELLNLALSEARAAEAARLQGLNDKEQRARLRSLRQQLAALERHSAAVSMHQSNLAVEFAAMATAADKARQLLPPRLLGPETGIANQLAPNYVRDLADVEAHRLSKDMAVRAPGAEKPPRRWGTFCTPETGTCPPLVEIVGQLCSLIKSKIEPIQIVASGASSPDAATAGDGVSPVAVPANPIEVQPFVDVGLIEAPADDHALAVPPEVLPPLDLTVDLRGQDLGVPKELDEAPAEPQGTDEWLAATAPPAAPVPPRVAPAPPAADGNAGRAA
jgi:hypothetical protein